MNMPEMTEEKKNRLEEMLEAQRVADEKAAAEAKAAQDALDAEAVKAEADAPLVAAKCDACGREFQLSPGTDTKNLAKALKDSGMPLPMFGQCKGAPAKCLLERARKL